MKVKKCRKCKTSIPAKANVCPYCFGRQWKSTLSILFIIIALVVAIGGYARLNINSDGTIERIESNVYERQLDQDSVNRMEDAEDIIESSGEEETDSVSRVDESVRPNKSIVRSDVSVDNNIKAVSEEEPEDIEKKLEEQERLRKQRLAREKAEREHVAKAIEMREKELEKKAEQEAKAVSNGNVNEDIAGQETVESSGINVEADTGPAPAVASDDIQEVTGQGTDIDTGEGSAEVSVPDVPAGKSE
ncbi:MAG: hypothetical protein JSV21_04015 [Nitrospirota bacterium]|nr:MAG: hypothetical protein JSV21_04015 [Nitrospirota bacterium]